MTAPKQICCHKIEFQKNVPGGRIIDNLQIENLQIDKLQIDNRQIDNQNLQIDNQHITFFRAFSDMNRTMADLLYSIMFSRASYSGILF